MFCVFLQGLFLFGHTTSASYPRPLSKDDEQMYLQAYANGCQAAKNTLIEHNLRLVAHITKKYSNFAGSSAQNSYSRDPEDLISIGTIGLIKAVVSFKHDKNVRLSTYAARCIENAIPYQR